MEDIETEGERNVKKLDGVYYLTENPMDFVIRNTEEVVEPATPAGNYHAATICYSKNRICFYIDHVPTDGTGWGFVLQTFMYYYYYALDKEDYPVPEGVRVIEDGVAEDQEADAYLMESAGDPVEMEERMGEKAYFQTPEAKAAPENLTTAELGHYVISVPSEEFMRYAKTVAANPSSLLMYLAAHSMQELNPDNMLTISSFFPVSVRKVMGNENSLLHQVVHTIAECEPALLNDEKAREFHQDFRKKLKQFSSEPVIRHMCGLYRGLIEEYKKAISADMLDEILESNKDIRFSFLMSYLGRINAGDYGKRIHIDAVKVLPSKDPVVYMMEVGGRFYISISLCCKTDVYVKEMVEHMKRLGMKDVSWKETD